MKADAKHLAILWTVIIVVAILIRILFTPEVGIAIRSETTVRVILLRVILPWLVIGVGLVATLVMLFSKFRHG